MIPLKGFGVGQATPPDNEGLQAIKGWGVLSFAGYDTFIGYHFVTPVDPSTGLGQVLKGHVDITNRNGSTITGTYEGLYRPIPDTYFVEFTLSVHLVGGKLTRLEGVTGESKTTAVLDTRTGDFKSSHAGVWTLPE
jgi:hypothetical protein